MSNRKKSEQLRMPFGTATGRLRKSVLYELLCELGRNTCFQCGELIESVDDLSMEHKKPWLDSMDPITLFFDVGNIAFSHLRCNSGNTRQAKRTHCPQGHAYDAENTYANPSTGGRQCKECRRRHSREHMRRKRGYYARGPS